MSHWIALFVAIAGNVGANIAFKNFMRSTEFSMAWSSVGTALSQLSFWLGIGLATALLGCYLYAIKLIPISTAYTVATGLSIAGVTCAGVILFGETVGLRALAGIVAVMAGVLLITTA